MKNAQDSTLEEIITYYKINYNGGFLPPENEINTIGYYHLKSDVKKAFPFFKLNVENYPTSSNAFDSLAEVYMLLGDKKNAIKNYKVSFKLNPRNNNAKKMIRKLESN